jgi:hypothetical protein
MANAKKISSAANTQLSISTVQLLSDVFEANNESEAVRGCDSFVINPEDGNVRVLWDGNTPTTALGMLLVQGQWLTIPASANLIRIVATTGTVKVNIQCGKANIATS